MNRNWSILLLAVTIMVVMLTPVRAELKPEEGVRMLYGAYMSELLRDKVDPGTKFLITMASCVLLDLSRNDGIQVAFGFSLGEVLHAFINPRQIK